MGRKITENEIGIEEENSVDKDINYSLASSEQETVINFMRNDDYAIISTSDTTMKTKFDKLCENNPDYYSILEENKFYKTYKVFDKSLISYRAKKREMSEEAKEAASERFKELHKAGKIGRKKKNI